MNSNEVDIKRLQKMLSAGRIVRGWRAEGAAPTWLLLPPLGMNASIWMPVLRELQGKHAGAAVDFAGFGSSDIGKADPGYIEQRAMLFSYLDLLHGPVVLVACSTAVPLALELARREEHRLDALILSGFGSFRSAESWLGRIKEASSSAEAFLGAMFQKPPACEATRQQVAENLTRPAYQSFFDRDAQAALSVGLKDIRVPTLLFAGRDDALVAHDEVEKLASSSHLARVEWQDECGHLAPLLRPAEFMRAAGSLLETMQEPA